MGLTANLVTGVWVGGEDRSIHFRNWVLGQGAKTAMPIWIDFMEKVYADPIRPLEKSKFTRPRQALPISLDCRNYLYTPSKKDSARSTLEDIF